MHDLDALLFIDANKYLDLYRTDKGRKLLTPLSESPTGLKENSWCTEDHRIGTKRVSKVRCLQKWS